MAKIARADFQGWTSGSSGKPCNPEDIYVLLCVCNFVLCASSGLYLLECVKNLLQYAKVCFVFSIPVMCLSVHEDCSRVCRNCFNILTVEMCYTCARSVLSSSDVPAHSFHIWFSWRGPPASTGPHYCP